MANEAKAKVVSKFKDLLGKYNIVATLDLYGLPAKQLQGMREELRGKCEILMAKHRLMRIALKETDRQGIAELENGLRGMPALLFTNDNPFKLFKILEKSKSPIAAKAGQIAPRDVIVPAGPTSFSPGPIIGELKSAKIDAGIVNGKIEIKSDSLVLKKGEEFSESMAALLARLDIKPMEVGLNLVSAYENGIVFDAEQLRIDEEAFMNDLVGAIQGGMNLSVEAVYPTKDNVTLILDKAIRNSRNLGINACVYSKDTMSDIIAKAVASANGLNSEL